MELFRVLDQNGAECVGEAQLALVFAFIVYQQYDQLSTDCMDSEKTKEDSNRLESRCLAYRWHMLLNVDLVSPKHDGSQQHGIHRAGTHGGDSPLLLPDPILHSDSTLKPKGRILYPYQVGGTNLLLHAEHVQRWKE